MTASRLPLAAALLVLTALAAPRPAAADDLDAIVKRGTLRVLVEPEALAELFSIKAGTPPGLEQELLQSFASLRKLKIEIVPTPFDERIPALLKGRGDMIAGGLVASAARRAQVDFSEELLPTRLVVVTRKPHRVVATILELKDEKVGVPKGGAASELLAAAGVPPGNVEQTPASEKLIQALRTGGVTAVVLSTGWAITEQKKDPALQLGVFLGAPTAIAFAVRRDQPKLRAALDDYIANVRRTPTWSRLVVKYFGESAKTVLARARQQ